MSRADDGSEEVVRGAIDRAESGAPAAGKAVRDRFSSDEIFQRVIASAEEEMASSTRELFFSGFAAGLAITLTFLAHAVGSASFPNRWLAAILYPVGFVYIILGRYQLYTENTLPPVALLLTRQISAPRLLQVWGIVLSGNVLGAMLGAFVLAHSHVLSPGAAQAGGEFARHGLEVGWWDLFFKALFAGWLVAGVVWLDHAARDTMARFVLIFLAFYTIAATELYHVVVTACDALYLVFTSGMGPLFLVAQFWLPVLLGNTIGGVVLVAVLNYAQTGEHRLPTSDADQPRLPLREWIFGRSRGEVHAGSEPTPSGAESDDRA